VKCLEEADIAYCVSVRLFGSYNNAQYLGVTPKYSVVLHKQLVRHSNNNNFCVSAAQRGLWPPRSRGFVITQNDVPQSVGLLWTCDQLVAETST
jgi:hypothetical protein